MCGQIQKITYRAFFIAIWQQANQREKTCGRGTQSDTKKLYYGCGWQPVYINKQVVVL